MRHTSPERILFHGFSGQSRRVGITREQRVGAGAGDAILRSRNGGFPAAARPGTVRSAIGSWLLARRCVGAANAAEKAESDHLDREFANAFTIAGELRITVGNALETRRRRVGQLPEDGGPEVTSLAERLGGGNRNHRAIADRRQRRGRPAAVGGFGIDRDVRPPAGEYEGRPRDGCGMNIPCRGG